MPFKADRATCWDEMGGGGGDAEVSEEEGHEISALLKPNPRDAGLQDAG